MSAKSTKSSSGGEDLIKQLQAYFSETAFERIELMRKAVKRGDHRAVEREAFAFRSSSSYLGAFEMAQISEELAQAALRAERKEVLEILDRLGALLALAKSGSDSEIGSTVSQSQTVLVVDDDPDVRELLRHSLERAGFRVLEASCGYGAFEVLASETVSAVISDLKMARGDGFMFLEKIQGWAKARGCSRLPVAVFTGSDHHSREEILQRGASEIFFKPTRVSVIAGWIQRSLSE